MSPNASIVGNTALEWSRDLGYAVGHGPHLAPGEPAAERDSFGEVAPDSARCRGCVTVRFSPTRYVPPQRVAQDVTERQQRVLLCLSGAADGLALREIRKGLGEGIAEWEIKNDLATLKHLGLVQVRGHARWARWVLS